MESSSEIQQEYENLIRNMEILQNSDGTNIDQVVNNTLKNLKYLRNSCAKGTEVQNYILSLSQFFKIITPILKSQLNLRNFNKTNGINYDDDLRRMSWQLIGNLCVQNDEVQQTVWNNLGHLILEELENEISVATNIQLMIVYNMFYSRNLKTIEGKIFKLMIKIWNKICNDKLIEISNFEFLQITMDHFLAKYPRILSIYGPLDTSERIACLKYISCYIRNDSSNGTIDKNLLNYISKDFKKKSDCFLRVVKNDEISNTRDPNEVFALLEVISVATGNEYYGDIFKFDHSLFLNCGALLQQLIEIGKQSKNTFTPMQKLEQVAIHSKTQSSDFEREISFELKTMLIRTLTNLLYKNPKNQEYAREVGIIMAICDCTAVDARNPLIKEWSILAIRNLCENCPENQEFIRNLCKVGDAPNDILKELNIEFGSLRIRTSE